MRNRSGEEDASFHARTGAPWPTGDSLFPQRRRPENEYLAGGVFGPAVARVPPPTGIAYGHWGLLAFLASEKMKFLALLLSGNREGTGRGTFGRLLAKARRKPVRKPSATCWEAF